MTAEPDGVAVRVLCYIEMPADGGDRAGAVLRVSVEDVSLADSPSVEVASVERPLRSDNDLDEPVQLEATLHSRHAYTVRAHVSSRGEREIQVGDLLSTSRHPIPAEPGTVSVHLQLVRV